jgi:hypothetical protein
VASSPILVDKNYLLNMGRVRYYVRVTILQSIACGTFAGSTTLFIFGCSFCPTGIYIINIYSDLMGFNDDMFVIFISWICVLANPWD